LKTLEVKEVTAAQEAEVPSPLGPPGATSVDLHRVLQKIVSFDFCWEWGGHRNPAGYGTLSTVRRKFGTSDLAHRITWEMFVGPIPDGMQVDHLRRNNACGNPEHLEIVTPRENTRRAGSAVAAHEALRRKAHCPKGHAYSEFGEIDNRGRRRCRPCRTEANRRNNERLTEKRRMARAG